MLASFQDGSENRMRYARGLLIMVVAVVCAVGSLPAADPSPLTTQPVEATLRGAMEAWGAEAHWRLWDMGTSASRAALQRQDFVERMRRGNTEPEVGGSLDAIDVLSESAAVALVRARFSVRHTRRGWSEAVDRAFLLRLEDGDWKVNLWDFVGLASYFPPEYLPIRPAPSPRGGRP
jgi:hypothetical protein